LAKPLFREETIVELKLEGESAAIIMEDADLQQALNPQFFPGQQQEVIQVRKLIGELDQLEQGLLRRALQHAITESSHDARVIFGAEATDYEISGNGLEIKGDAMDERERNGPLRVSPVAVVFIQAQ